MIILEVLKKQVNKKSQVKSSHCASIFGPKYLKGTFFGIGVTMLCQFTGANMWNMYSNRIFTKINPTVQQEKRIAANLLTQVIGSISFLSALGASYFIQKLPRRRLYLISQTQVAVCLIVTSICIEKGNPIVALIFIVFQIMAFQLGVGALHWLYLPEFLSDTQFGFVLTCHYSCGILIALSTEWMVKVFSPQGMVLFYGVVTSLGFFYMLLFLKETSGLSDRQKKQLYVNKKYLI